jgi:hypothetical protein
LGSATSSSKFLSIHRHLGRLVVRIWDFLGLSYGCTSM